MPPIQPLPFDAPLSHYEKQAEEVLTSYQSGNSSFIRQFNEHHLSFRNWSKATNQDGEFNLNDSQQLVARLYGFETWEKLIEYINDVTQADSSVWQFESAVEAIINGETTTLDSLLRANPTLIRMRSTRVHRAMLLHYIGANGVENYRQKSPRNAVDVARILLKAGAEVDALADTYGKGTTLGLVATSIHPKQAGVQIPLIDTLLNYGADIDCTPTGWPPLMAALANGCPEAAETLRRNGARIDSIVAAAGLGRLKLVKSFFSEDGQYFPNESDTSVWGVPKEPTAQLERAFLYACTYGHITVAEFLLSKGVNPNAQDTDGQTSLHVAVLSGQLDMVKWLIDRNTPLEVKNGYGGTVLSQALWCVVNGNPDLDYVPIVEVLLNAGALIEPGTLDWLAQQDTLSPTKRTRIEEVFRKHGANS
ncbi:ankyrin repeat domain-containing protein [Spirosoma sp. HMF4905]|uniref:Ankyrin repeat domain-containing protein n=1 Tax=Spirosoma arboris TaxID=2682092 RepID=A0A7K1S5X9_9BACT|nr:ankyrin repeat domain-containing protein [Spirosoma arboris]MVM29056.1 ankyrin repeat domain-containing protein [Spirosoma arboris]